MKKLILITVGIIIFIAVFLIPTGLKRVESTALATLCLMAFWWVTEAIPIHYTSLVPIVTFPIFGISSNGFLDNTSTAITPFFKNDIFLFLGGMFIAAGMQKSQLHRRFALLCLYTLGTSEKGLLIGFLLSTMFISLWISNTATAVMMAPIAISLIKELEHKEGRKLPGFSLAIMLSVAYASNIGGIGTKIGTAPNTQFTGFVKQWYNIEIDFLTYLPIGLPFSIIMIVAAYLVLSRLLNERIALSGREAIKNQLQSLGRMSPQEKRVLFHFITAVLLWTMGKPIIELTGIKSGQDAIAAMAVALSMTLTRCFDRSCLGLISWHALLLLGGSFALAEGIEKSGLIREFSLWLHPVKEMEPLTATAIILLCTIFISAFTSNTATSAIMSQLVHSILPRHVYLLSGVAIASSLDFMLPAGTPPNAIVFASGYVRIKQMVRVGIFLNLLGALLSTFWIYYAVRFFIA